MQERPCPSCDHGSFEDELAVRKIGRTICTGTYTVYVVECSCGVRGPEAKTKDEALEKWNAMPRRV